VARGDTLCPPTHHTRETERREGHLSPLVALGVELRDRWSVVGVERLIERLVEHALRRLVRVCQHAHGGGSSDERPNAESK
jgi:hypothetical protein